MRVSVTHGIDDLLSDMAAIPPRAVKDMVRVVREGVKTGNTVAKDLARVSAGAHGGVSRKGVRPYVKSFSWEMNPISGGFGAYSISGVYGPDASKPQGNMSFEGGSRNQRPHRDLAKSADLIGPAFLGEVRRLPDNWFWGARP